jgi:hypothetical protein
MVFVHEIVLPDLTGLLVYLGVVNSTNVFGSRII